MLIHFIIYNYEKLYFIILISIFLPITDSSILQLFISNQECCILTQVRIETEQYFSVDFLRKHSLSSILKAVKENLTSNCLDNIFTNSNSD